MEQMHIVGKQTLVPLSKKHPGQLTGLRRQEESL